MKLSLSKHSLDTLYITKRAFYDDVVDSAPIFFAVRTEEGLEIYIQKWIQKWKQRSDKEILDYFERYFLFDEGRFKDIKGGYGAALIIESINNELIRHRLDKEKIVSVTLCEYDDHATKMQL